VVKRHGDEWATAENIVSNGPFLLEKLDNDASKMHFVRNPNYHGRVTGNVMRVEALYFRQPTGWQHHLALYAQDLIDTVPMLNWGREGFELARRRHLSEYNQNPLFTTFIYCFDTTRPPFDDVRVRQAFAMTNDRAQALARFGTKISQPTFGGFIPPEMPGHSPDLALPFAPDRARQRLAEAGYPDGKGFPTVEMAQFYVPGGDDSNRHSIEQWQRELGVQISYQVLEWTAYWRHLAHETPNIMAISGLGTYGDPDAFMRQSFRTMQKLSGWHHPDYERLIAQASHSSNHGERLRFYQQADTLLIWEAALIPVSYQDAAFLTKPWVKHMPHSPVTASTFWKNVVLAPASTEG
jgi:oligopeptide transport system substrate-binding protein